MSVAESSSADVIIGVMLVLLAGTILGSIVIVELCNALEKVREDANKARDRHIEMLDNSVSWWQAKYHDATKKPECDGCEECSETEENNESDEASDG